MFAVGVLSALTFYDAWETVRQEHGSIRAVEFERLRYERLRAASRSLLLPQINVEAKFTRLDDPIRIDLDPILGLLPGLPPGLPPLGVTVQEQEFWKANVTAVWPLYTGGRITAGRTAAVLELEAAEEKGRWTTNELHSMLVKRYFAVALAQQVNETMQISLDGSRQHRDQALRLQEEGLISYAERLHAEVAFTEAERAARHSARQLEMARTALSLFLNREGVTEIATLLPEPAEDLNLDAAGLRNLARRQHPILNTLAINQRLAEEGTRAERGRMQPEVFAFGKREMVTSDLTLLEPKWAVGIGVNLALLDRSDRVNRVRAARLRERQVEALYEQLQRDIETLVENSVLEVEQAIDQLRTLDSMVSLVQENLRVRERAFAEGLATSMEVVDARIGVARVETARAAARYQFTVNYAILMESIGSIENFNHILDHR
ncbi:MAG: TolC family protein [Verrucomicrobia bacterium]|nr:TolC family protein [Verrucomicrobiota bacterium]